MDGNDPLPACQTDTSSRKLADRMQTLKNAEQLIGISHIETDPIVAYIKRPLLDVRFLSEFDLCPVLFGGELPGIAQQVLQDNAQEVWIAFHHQVGSDRECDLPVGLTLLQGLRDFLR